MVLAGGRVPAQSPPAASAQVTYSNEVAPVLLRHCAACHQPGASAPFSLLSYDEVRPRAREIVRAVESRNMPPWKPEPGHGDFAGERRLTSEEIVLIRRWADQGFARGNGAARPAAASAARWQLGEPDLIVSMPEPYTLRAGTSDVFRTFVVPIPSGVRRYVRAVEFHPGNFQVVHHLEISRMEFDRSHVATHAGRNRDDERAKHVRGAGSQRVRFGHRDDEIGFAKLPSGGGRGRGAGSAVSTREALIGPASYEHDLFARQPPLAGKVAMSRLRLPWRHVPALDGTHDLSCARAHFVVAEQAERRGRSWLMTCRAVPQEHGGDLIGIRHLRRRGRRRLRRHTAAGKDHRGDERDPL